MLQSVTQRQASHAQRPGGQGFASKRRTRLHKAVALTVTAFSVLFSPLSITSALAASPRSSYPLPTTFDGKLVNDLLAAQLTNQGFRLIVRDYYSSLSGLFFRTGGANSYTADELLAIPTSDPLYYSATTPRYYKYKLCTSDPLGYFIMGNLLAQSGDHRPEAKDYWDPTDSPQPVTNMTFDLCTQPKNPFTYPAGFMPAASNGAYVFIRTTFPFNLAASVPEDPQRPGQSRDSLAIVLARTNGFAAASFPYTQQGTAVYGTDYTAGPAVNGSGVDSGAFNSPPSGITEEAATSAAVSVYFRPINHPQQTLQWMFTAAAGYTFLGQPAWNARLEALNNSTVTVSASGGQSTITPGSTSGGFVLTRANGDQSKPLTVAYSIGGTAANGTDYGYLSGNATIAAGQSTVNIPIITSAPSGSTAVPQKDVLISLATPADYSYFTPTAGAAGQSNDFIIPAYNPSTVSFTQGAGGATLTPGQSQPFTVTRSGGDTTKPLTVNYTTGGTAQSGVDYQPVSGSVTIPAGATTASVPLSAIQHTGTTAFPATTLSLTPAAGTGYDATGAQPINYNIPAYTPSTVSFAQGAGGGTLTPGQPQQVTVSRTGSTAQPLTVSYATGGTATPGSDYKTLPGSVTIPAGATSATIPVESIQQTGTTAQPSKTLSLTPTAGAGYDASGATPSNFTIPAYTPSAVSVSSPANGGAIPAGGSAPFTVTRTGDTSQPLTIPYTIGGTATPGTDYSQLPGSITIPAGATSATQTITTPTQNGSTAQPSKSIVLTPQAGSGYSVDPNSPSATYQTAAYTPSSVTPAPGSGGSTIPQGTTGGFTVTRTGSTAAALPVTYSLGGTAQNGTDYNQLPGSVTIPAGQASVTVPVTVPAATGSTATPAKDIQVTVNPGNGYAPDSTTPATTLTIPAYAPSMVNFGTGSGGTLTPGGTSDGFTVTRSGSTTQPLTVGLGTAGSATPGVDYGQLPASVTIPAGATSVTVPLRAFPQSGTAAIPQKDVQITLQPGSGYAPSSSTPATYTIPAYSPNANGNPAVTVSVPTGQNTVLMPGTSTNGFTVTRSGATTSPLPINYTVGGTGTSGTDYSPLSGTVTIPAGATSATVPISVPSGATVGKTVSIDLTPGTGYSQGTNSGVTYTVGNLAPTPVPTIGLGFDPSMPAFVVTRTGGNPTQPLTVPVDFGGSGVPGVDYAQLPNAVTFGAGKTTATVPVKLLSTATTGDTITASIPDGSGYTVGSGNGTAFTVPAGYNDGSNVSTIGLSFDPTVPAFVVTRTGGDTSKTLMVPVNFGGSGVPGVDYSQLPGSVTFGAGKTTATVPVTLLPTAKTGETITASIPAGSGYKVGSGNGTSFTVPAGYNDGSNVAKAPTTAGKKKAGGGATGLLVAGGAVGGSIALGTGVLGVGGAAGAAGAGSLAVPGLLASSVFGLVPQVCSTTGDTPTELVRLIPQLKDGQPNWSAMTFKGLTAPAAAGSVKLGNVTRSWKAGQPVSEIVRVADTDGSFNLNCMGLSKLANLGQMGTAAKPLSALNLVADTTVQGLSKTLYLRAKKVGDVKGMAEFIASKSDGKFTAEQLNSMSFADVFKSDAALGGLQMGSMPLNKLPGYSDILLGDVPNWKSATVGQVLGLANVPFSQFPTQPKPLAALK